MYTYIYTYIPKEKYRYIEKQTQIHQDIDNNKRINAH